jgi:hypothetical protein
LWTRLRKLCLGDPAAWAKVNGEFWRIAKASDTSSQETFDDEWDDFMELFTNSANVSGKDYDDQLKWLEGLRALAPQWAARYVWSVCTWGIHSTQRAEAFHSAIKGFLKAGMLAGKLVSELEEYNDDSRSNKDVVALRLGWKQTSPTSLLASVQGRVTPFAFQLLLSQYKESTKYKAGQGLTTRDGTTYQVCRTAVHKMSGSFDIVCDSQGFVTDYSFAKVDYGVGCVDPDAGRTVRLVRRTGGSSDGGIHSITCSCQFSSSWRLPCRHCLRVIDVLEVDVFPFNSFGSKWLVLDGHQESTLLRTMMHAPRPMLSAPAPLGASTGLDPRQRESILMLVVRQILDIGTYNDVKMDLVERQLQALLIQVSPSPKAAGAPPSSSACGGRASAAGSGVAASPAAAAPRDKRRCKPAIHRADLCNLMANDYVKSSAKEITDDHMDLLGQKRREWIDRHVAVRYENGWVIGVIKKRLNNARKTCK